ncbi:MAG TPA: TetR family transcriptional regulator [Nonomuraea sp.]|uniref:TetR/AcrR family transcriptional regulator n=1 Tax=Nonomuraea sp. NPDC049649 TaxID=3155776 RepID=UPI002B76A1B7|nr:TetR family transcriptional regulator [Nonomuraea sp.]
MDTTTLGLRERKKAETRQAVHEAALRLVVEHGFDGVTVEAIADAANISRRTFSNYFAGKEDALLYGEGKRFRRLVALVREQPPGDSAWQAMWAAIEQLYEEVGIPDREWAVRTRLAKKHPALLARQLAIHAALERELAQAIADRRAPARPRVMAAAFLGALRLATHQWIEEEESRSLVEISREIMDEVARPFT